MTLMAVAHPGESMPFYRLKCVGREGVARRDFRRAGCSPARIIAGYTQNSTKFPLRHAPTLQASFPIISSN